MNYLFLLAEEVRSCLPLSFLPKKKITQLYSGHDEVQVNQSLLVYTYCEGETYIFIILMWNLASFEVWSIQHKLWSVRFWSKGRQL